MKSTTVPLAVGLVVLSIGCEQRLPPGSDKNTLVMRAVVS